MPSSVHYAVTYLYHGTVDRGLLNIYDTFRSLLKLCIYPDFWIILKHQPAGRYRERLSRILGRANNLITLSMSETGSRRMPKRA